MVFWVSIAILCLLAVIPAALGLFRSYKTVRHEQDSDRTIYEARVAEIESDLKLGRIDAASGEIAKAEEARRFLKLNADGQNTGTAVNPIANPIISTAMIGLFVPVFSILIYLTQIEQFPQAVEQSQLAQQQASLADLLKVAEKRLADQPDDVRGWRVVAPVYMRAGRFEDAENAFRNLIRLEGSQLDLLQGLAEALVLKTNGAVGDEALSLFEKINTENSDNTRVAYFLGVAAAQREEIEKARNIWQGLLTNANGDEPWLVSVRENLANLSSDRDLSSSLSVEQMGRVEAMVEGLAQRLEDETGSQEDWQRLVRSYMVLGRPQDAEEAFNKASRIFEDHPEYIAGLRELILTDDRGDQQR